MPVLEQITEQITEASDKLFDAAVSTNDKAHDATKNLVTKIQDADVKLPYADKISNAISDVELPLADKLPEIEIPEPLEAVDAYFNFVGKGIEVNRTFTMKLINLISDTTTEGAAVIETTAKKAAPKKTTAKKTTAKKAPAKKATAAKATAKKTPAKKAPAKKATAKKA